MLSGQNLCYIYFSLIREDFKPQTHKKIISLYHSYFQGKDQHKWRRAEKRKKGKRRKERKDFKVEYEVWEKITVNAKTYFSVILINQSQIWSTRKWGYNRKFLKLDWSDFHLSSLGGVLISFPVIPVDAISAWRVFSVMIHTVQVGVMAGIVPPASFIGHSTVSTAIAVIILIFGAKGLTTMIRKRITSSSWKKARTFNCVRQM